MAGEPLRLSRGWVVYSSDRLVTRWRNIKDKRRQSRGKKVSKNCPIDAETRRLYVKSGPIPAIKRIMETKQCGLRAAKDIFDFARKGNW